MPQRVRQSIYSLPKKRPKTGAKVKNAIKHHNDLVQMITSGEDSAWVQGALKLSSAKLLKYGMSHMASVAPKKAKAAPLKKAA